jgi:hypothetical protein
MTDANLEAMRAMVTAWTGQYDEWSARRAPWNIRPGQSRSLHALRRPAAEKRQGTKSRVGNGGGAATMGISPRGQASMWGNVAAT